MGKGRHNRNLQRHSPSSHQVTVTARREQIIYAAPIPPPQIVAGWEQVCPGSADRILKQFENQSAHRQDKETKVIDSNIKNEGKSQYLAFAFCVIVVLCGTFLIYAGKEVIGLTALCGAIVAPAGLFIFAKVQGKKELKDSKDAATEALQRHKPRKI